MVQKQNSEGRIEHFNSSHWEKDSDLQSKIQDHLGNDEIRLAIIAAFELAPDDAFQYWAHMPVTLGEMQHVVNMGDVKGLHHWYNSDSPVKTNDSPTQPYAKPSRKDTDAYISVFNPALSAANALRALEEEGKSASIRRHAGAYLRAKRDLDSDVSKVSKNKQAHWNPGLTFWAWYCRNAEWAGPVPETGLRSVNHPVLPVLMHHFGCVVPTWESIELLRAVTSKGRKTIHEIGSGNGYWAYLLRQAGLEVQAVDNGQSVFRTNWIGDTINMDALKYLASAKGAPDGVLLMVYPVVSGEFTRKVLAAYQGNDIVVAGTQNGNGYTGFKDKTMDAYVADEMPGWTKTAQIALPSYPGKDEALFVFVRESTRRKVDDGDRDGIEKEEVQMEGRNAKANARKKAKKKAKALSQTVETSDLTTDATAS